jgi:hypothetical protein
MPENNKEPNPITILLLKQPIELGSASSETKKACQRTRKQRVAQDLFTRWPNLREASNRLTSYLTPHWPDPRDSSQSLLVNCLNAALMEAKAAYETDGDIAEQKAFIVKASEELGLSMAVSLMLRRKTGWILHDPLSEALDEVIKSFGLEALAWIDAPHAGHDCQRSRLICASRVFRLKDLKLAGLLDKAWENIS